MDSLFRSLSTNEILLYIILGLGVLVLFRKALLSWLEWRRSVFSLEKELAFSSFRSSAAGLVVLLMIGLSSFCFTSFILPSVPFQVWLYTPTPNLFAPTPIPNATTDGTPLPTPVLPPPGSEGCVPGKLIFTEIMPGDTLSGQVVLKGTVDVQNFGFYKLEYSAPGGEWQTVTVYANLVREDELGSWDTTPLVPGDYRIRLYVTDTTGAELMPPCIFPVRVAPPPP